MSLIDDLIGAEATLRLGWTLLHFLWQGAAAAIILTSLLRFMRPRSAQARYATAFAGLILMAACPMVTFAVLGRGGERVIVATPVTMATIPSVPTGSDAVFVDERVPRRAEWSSQINDSIRLIVFLWGIGTLLLATYRAGAWGYVHLLRLRGEEATDGSWRTRFMEIAFRVGVKRRVRLLNCRRIDTPAVVGVIRPAILLPLGCLMHLPPAYIEAILAHELAHIRRHDYLFNLVQTAIETILFFHPATWWISRCIRIERENACDDIAVKACGNEVLYAEALVAMEELRHAPAPALAMVGSSPGGLLDRIRRILHIDQPAQRGTWWPAAGLVVVAFLLVLTTRSTQLAAETTQPTTDRSRVATIRCIDEGGQPVHDAEVYVRDSCGDGMSAPIVTFPPRAKTDQDGVARMADLPSGPLERSSIDVYARVSSKLAGIESHSPNVVGGKPVTDPITVVMRPVATLRGKLTAPQGAKLEGLRARIRLVNNTKAGPRGERIAGGQLSPITWPNGAGWWDGLFDYAVNADGTFAITDLPNDAGVFIDISGPGVATVHLSGSAKHELADGLHFKATSLAAEAIIKGSVALPDGTGCEGVELFARSRTFAYSGPMEHSARALADSRGHFAFSGLPDGLYVVTMGSLPDGWTGAPTVVRVAAGETKADVKFLLERGVVVSGRVVDAKDDRPLAGARVGASRPFEIDQFASISASAPTDAEGRFSIRVPAGDVQFAVDRFPKGYGWIDPDRTDTQRFLVRAGEAVPEIQFKLGPYREPSWAQRNRPRPLATARGRVIDPQGKPVEGARIAYRIAQPNNGNPYPGTLMFPATKADGSYELPMLEPGISHIIEIEPWNTTKAISEPVTPSLERVTEIPNLIVTPKPVVSELSGIVVDDEKRPIAGTLVTIQNAAVRYGVAASSDDQGRFRFDLHDSEALYSISIQSKSVPMRHWSFLPAGTRNAEFMIESSSPTAAATTQPAQPLDPARLLGKSAPAIEVAHWISGPPAPPIFPRNDGRLTVLMLPRYCSTAAEYREQLQQLDALCAGRDAAGIAIFSQRFHEASVRHLVADLKVGVSVGLDRSQSDSMWERQGATYEAIGSLNRNKPTILIINANGVVRGAYDSVNDVPKLLGR